jgi:hypothetical protein
VSPSNRRTTIIGAAIIAILFAIFANAIKLHDRLSDVLLIRYKFDVNCVLYPLAIVSGASVSVGQFLKLRQNRKLLMSKTFYNYVSSTRPVIDSHTITQALTNWSWFWACLEAISMFSLSALILVFNGAFQPAAWLFIVCATLLLFMQFFLAQAIIYAESQVTEVLQCDTRRAAVEAEFNAL